MMATKIRSVMLVCLAMLLWNGADAITASKNDFTVDCGTEPGAIEKITFMIDDPSSFHGKIISPNNNDTCQLRETIPGTYELSDVKNKCTVTSNPGSPDYFLMLRIQAISFVIQKTDPNFLIICRYVIDTGSNSSTGVQILEGVLAAPEPVEHRGNTTIDQKYELLVVRKPEDSTAATTLEFGETAYLKVQMSGTDEDERGVRVERCIARSGSTFLSIVELFCVVPQFQSLFTGDGFISYNDNTAGVGAILQMTVFKIEDGPTEDVKFDCVVEICRTTCTGVNCPGKTGRRRREVQDDGDFFTMTTGIRVI